LFQLAQNVVEKQQVEDVPVQEAEELLNSVEDNASVEIAEETTETN